MKKNKVFSFSVFALFFTIVSFSQPIIIDHNCAFLDPIPASAINQAHATLHIAYGHTSHGSQLTEGMSSLVGQTNLVGYKGDIYCWDYYYNDDPGGEPCLDIDDYFRAGDLGHNGDTQWAADTRDYLNNDPYSGDINVVMWSWCGGCSDNTYTGIETYLNTMNQLEIDYPTVHFVYMTGHTDIGSDAVLKANNQHIRDYCVANNKILYDFADIERYDPDDNYYEFVNDDCTYYDSDNNELGNWATEWQNSHTEGVDWYDCYAAHSQLLNGNRKAYAAWWLFARLAGWAGPLPVEESELLKANIFKSDQVKLTWATASEQNNKGFEIQRSTNAKTWEKIGWVDGNGNAIEQNFYYFIDKNPIQGINYYRYVQVDFNNNLEYSKITSVNFKKHDVNLYPNPVSGILNIGVKSCKVINTVMIYNQMGQELLRTKPIDGQIDLSSLPKGLYILKVEINEGIVEKIVIIE